MVPFLDFYVGLFPQIRIFIHLLQRYGRGFERQPTGFFGHDDPLGPWIGSDAEKVIIEIIHRTPSQLFFAGSRPTSEIALLRQGKSDCVNGGGGHIPDLLYLLGTLWDRSAISGQISNERAVDPKRGKSRDLVLR